MDEALQAQLESALGCRIHRFERVRGGDINRAFSVDLADDSRVFVKTLKRAPAGAFAKEAEGLRWLAVPQGPRVPELRCVNDRFLALEWIESGERDATFDETLGRQLAAMHAASPPHFGLDADNFIAHLPQSNRKHVTWAEFFAQERVLPLTQACVARGLWRDEMQVGFEALVTALPERIGEPEAPARLHGDLWSGNVMCGPQGEPVLVDPAVYAGHREMDLAMMKLFGGFSQDCFDAYDEAFELQPGWQERLDLWQLYPLLVHALLFGGGYAGRCMEVMRRWA